MSRAAILLLLLSGCASAPHDGLVVTERMSAEVSRLLEAGEIVTSEGRRVKAKFDVALPSGCENAAACHKVMVVYHNDDRFLPPDTLHVLYVPSGERAREWLEHELGHVYYGNWHP